MAGWIYILSHSSGTTVKVGETKVSPKSRAKDYSRVYKLKGFKLHKTFSVPEEARKGVERIAHRKLQKFQLSGIGGAREMFSCDIEEAQQAITTAIDESKEVAKQVELEKQKKADEKARREAKKKAEKSWKVSKSKQKKEYDQNNLKIDELDKVYWGKASQFNRPSLIYKIADFILELSKPIIIIVGTLVGWGILITSGYKNIFYFIGVLIGWLFLYSFDYELPKHEMKQGKKDELEDLKKTKEKLEEANKKIHKKFIERELTK